MSNTGLIKSTVRYYKSLLKDFHIPWTIEIEHKIIELYPNDIAIENYMLTVILNYLDKKIIDKEGILNP